MLVLAFVWAAPGAAAEDELRVMLVGQALIKRDLRPIAPAAVAQARAYFAGAEVVFTNFEGTVAPAGAKLTPRGASAAYGGPEVLQCLREMGFNLLSLANNHAWDLQEAGLFATRDEAARAGLAHAGTGANVTEASSAGFMDTPAGRVALVAMASGGVQLTPETRAGPTRAGVNFLEVKPDGTLDPEQRERLLAVVRAAARQARAVIVYHHNHYWGEPRGQDGPPGRERRIDRFTTPAWMEVWARQLVDAGASLFVAHGNPALHGIEIYRGKPLLYGLGNYIFQSSNSLDRYGPLAALSAVVEVRFNRDRLGAVRIRPLVLALEGEARGAPFLAQGGEAAAVLATLADQSRRYGTELSVSGETAEVRLGAGPAAGGAPR
jgi:poly-gamma-glutamate synthesis protein (capsule biosynthesis protein)